MQNKIKEFEEKSESNSTDVGTTKTMVGDMLSSIPQVTSIEERFSGIEGRMDEYEYSQSTGETTSNVSTLEVRMNEIEQNVQEIRSQVSVQYTQDVSNIYDSPNVTEPWCSRMKYSDPTSLVEVANEIQERNKRARSLVIHNLPEAINGEEEMKNVSSLLQEILPNCERIEFECDQFSQKPKVYRLGQPSSNRVRSLKVHLKHAEIKEDIICNTRRLASSENYRTVVVQKDLSPLERIHLKNLVYEKNRRNHAARARQQEANWMIRGGILCRKGDC